MRAAVWHECAPLVRWCQPVHLWTDRSADDGQETLTPEEGRTETSHFRTSNRESWDRGPIRQSFFIRGKARSALHLSRPPCARLADMLRLCYEDHLGCQSACQQVSIVACAATAASLVHRGSNAHFELRPCMLRARKRSRKAGGKPVGAAAQMCTCPARLFLGGVSVSTAFWKAWLEGQSGRPQGGCARFTCSKYCRLGFGVASAADVLDSFPRACCRRRRAWSGSLS